MCRKRLLDLSNQAYYKGIICFSDFLNLNELHIYHSLRQEFSVDTESFGGYEEAERQMAAFIPDALSYAHGHRILQHAGAIPSNRKIYPLCCIRIIPAYPKYAEKLTHRDILGAVMHLGIKRNRIGDIICKSDEYFMFCEQEIAPFVFEQLAKVKHTSIKTEQYDMSNAIDCVSPDFEECTELIASNRIDAIIAKAYHLSRTESAAVLAEEKVFINGRKVCNSNESCKSGDIISVRGKGRFIFETTNLLTKKGKLKVDFKFFK